MRTRRLSLAFVGVATLAFVGYLTVARLQARAAAEAAANAAQVAGNPFPGKVLLVFLDSRSSIPLSNPEVRKLGDATFLVGKGSEDLHGHHWANKRTVWLPLERVEMITEFDSVDEMKKAWKEAMESLPPDVPPPTLPKEKAPPPQRKE